MGINPINFRKEVVLIDRTMTAIADRALYIPDYDVIASMKMASFEERVVQPFGQTSFQSTQKSATVAASRAVPQLKAPRAGVAWDAEQVESLAEIVRSTGIDDADISSTLKRISGNVDCWEASLAEKVQAHAEAVSVFSVSVGHAQTAVDDCERGAPTPAKLNAAAVALAEAARNEITCGVAAKALPSTPESLGIDVTHLLTGTALLTMALAKLQKLMSDSDIDALDSQRKMLNELSAARQATLQKASDDYAAKLAEAKHLQDMVGEISKIGGWALTIIGVGLAIFTGGASLLIAAAGLALMAADAICKAVTGTSFVDEAMKPVMDHAVKPMMEWLSKKVASALEECGVSKEKAEIAGAVVAGVAVAAVMVTGVVAIGSVAGKIASVVAESTAKELAEVMESAVVRSVKDVMVKLADDTGVTSMASRAKTLLAEMRAQVGLDGLEEGQIRAVAKRGEAGLAMGQAALSGTEAAMNTIAAANIRDASVMQAAVTRALADKKVITQLLQELATTVSNSLSAMTSLGNAMSDALKSETAADTFVLNNARAV
ncbi:hypothetical protein ST27_01480 [Xanthomonas phaseoli pv. phaseoli]|nr:hypothetical protein ST27_01480 [Xanthomonas phaseoli pv. phaseoli]